MGRERREGVASENVCALISLSSYSVCVLPRDRVLHCGILVGFFQYAAIMVTFSSRHTLLEVL